MFIVSGVGAAAAVASGSSAASVSIGSASEEAPGGFVSVAARESSHVGIVPSCVKADENASRMASGSSPAA
jgi:hypothetical protein